MAFANTLDIPYTVYGGLSTVSNGGVNTLSGYTCNLTDFEFVITKTDDSFNFISSDNFVWDFGDGSKSTSASASHIYNFPGVYNVTLLAYDSAGNEYLSTEVKQLSVSDFYPDRLDFGNRGVTNTLNIPSNIKNAVHTPIKIERMNTHQVHHTLSADKYTINLYASGSESFDRSTMLDDKWLHLDKTWSFYKVTTADNGEQQLESVTSIDSTSEKIYFRKYNKFQSQWIERVAKDDLAKYPDAVFVGTSGTSTFYYGDTLPVMTEEPVFVFCSLDTTKLPDYRDILRGNMYQSLHPTGHIDLPSLYSRVELVVPIRIRYRPAKSLTFTGAGMKSIPFTSIKWQNNSSPFFVDLLDEDGNITMSYPDLSGKQAVSGTGADTTTFVTNLSVISADTTNLDTATATNLLSAHFYRNTEFELPTRVNSKFSGLMVPYDVADDVHLTGSCNVYTEPHFSKDTVIFGIGNRDTKQVNVGILHDVYTTEEYDVKVTKNVHFTKHVGLNDFHADPSVTYFHKSSSYTDDTVMGLFAGTKIDAISGLNTRSNATSSISLSTINDGVNKAIPTDNPFIVSDYHNGPAGKHFVPAHIGASKKRTAWVALSASCTVMEVSFDQLRSTQFSISDKPTIENVIRISENKVYDTLTGNVPDNMVDPPNGTTNLFEPTLVDSDINGDVWVGFTNPVSGSVRKYNINSNLDKTNYEIFKLSISQDIIDALIAAYGSESEVTELINNLKSNIIRKLSELGISLNGILEDYKTNNINQKSATIEFAHKHVVPTDIVTTNNGDCWVSTTDRRPGLAPDLTIAAGNVSALSASPDIVKYEFTDEEVDGVEAGYIVNIEGFSSDYFNGKFLVVSVDTLGDVITVKPFRGKVSNLPLAVDTTGGGKLSAYTDNVYKLNSAGTTVYNISGFFQPEHICTDKYNNLWVAHDVNTVTKVTTAGQISTSIKVFDTAHADMYASAGSTYAYTASSDQLHLGGITFDTYNNMYVVNAYEGRLYKIPLSTPTLSSSYTISDTIISETSRPVMPFGRHTTRGDWNGFRWLNKFDNTTGTSTISGFVTFNLYPSGGKYSVAKINEKFDPIETIKTYRTQPVLVENGKVLFDDLYGSAVGSLSSNPDVLGRVVYEKIANFTDNIADPSTCNIKSLYSLCDMTGLNIARYDFDYSGGLHRIMNLVSIPHKKLWGERSRFNRDFETFGTTNSAYGINLGDKVDTTTYMVTAGTPIVVRQLFNNVFKYISTMYVSGADTDPHYVSDVSAVSSYPLSSYNSAWGWGLGNNIDQANVTKFFEFYEFTDKFSDIQLEGIIDWSNTQTNISESVSGTEAWYGDDKIADTLIDYELRRGLGMFNTNLSAADTGIL